MSRELLVTAPGLSEFISGAILFDETLHQNTRDGVPMAEVPRAAQALVLRAIPAAVAGIAFLSGGQAAELATARLHDMHPQSTARGPAPGARRWRLHELRHEALPGSPR